MRPWSPSQECDKRSWSRISRLKHGCSYNPSRHGTRVEGPVEGHSPGLRLHMTIDVSRPLTGRFIIPIEKLYLTIGDQGSNPCSFPRTYRFQS